MKKTLTILFAFFIALTPALAQDIAFQQEKDKVNEIRIYPNPATTDIQVEITNSTLESPFIYVHSIIGNRMNVKVEQIKQDLYQIDLQSLPAGYYLIVIKEQGFNKTYKFLKN